MKEAKAMTYARVGSSIADQLPGARLLRRESARLLVETGPRRDGHPFGVRGLVPTVPTNRGRNQFTDNCFVEYG